jgi:rhodanese-related sulfurtransferase
MKYVKAEKRGEIFELQAEDFKQNSAGVQAVDVRRPDEWKGELGHIEGVHLATLENDLPQKLASLDKNTPCVFICRSGARSFNAGLLAKSLGFQEIYNLSGGMIRWNELGFPITR